MFVAGEIMPNAPGTVSVKVLCTEGCSATPATIDLIYSVAAEINVPVSLEKILVESPDQANELQFLGSPTVQVNGLDIDPSARNSTDFGFM